MRVICKFPETIPEEIVRVTFKSRNQVLNWVITWNNANIYGTRLDGSSGVERVETITTGIVEQEVYMFQLFALRSLDVIYEEEGWVEEEVPNYCKLDKVTIKNEYPRRGLTIWRVWW